MYPSTLVFTRLPIDFLVQFLEDPHTNDGCLSHHIHLPNLPHSLADLKER
jgi:hypothetical protein